MAHVAGCKVYDRTPGDQLHLVKRLIATMPEDAQLKVAIGRALLARIINAADRQLTEREPGYRCRTRSCAALKLTVCNGQTCGWS